MRIVTASQMRAAEGKAISSGARVTNLVEAASGACVTEVIRRWPGRSILVICGPGGNGHDGLVIARRLKEAGRGVQVLYYNIKDDAMTAATRAGWSGPINTVTDTLAGEIPRMFKGVGDDFLVVDAMFGIGASRELEGAAAALSEQVKDLDLPVLAVDLPSGLLADSSAVTAPHFRADVTVTFGALKPVHVLEPAAMGRVVMLSWPISA